MDWEAWFRNAADPPSNNEDDKRDSTERQIKDALRAYEPLQGKPYRVYVKGSYANNTNVRLDYDVDIAVEYEGCFYSDLIFDLEGTPKEDIGVSASDDPYTPSLLRADVLGALEATFGNTSVERGNIALRVRDSKTTLPADVVPCWEYRRYERLDQSGIAVFQKGSKIFPKGGSPTTNFPDQQKSNGNQKNVDTGYRYKYMVRAIKKLHSRLIDEGLLANGLPSYLIECLVYNVPKNQFGHDTYVADVRAILATIFNATLSIGGWNDWEEVNGLKYLFRGGPAWTHEQVNQFAGSAWDHVGFT
jgi:predicted nucleotidyltransferase